MPDVLMQPGVAFIPTVIAGVLVALYGLVQWEWARRTYAEVRTLPTRYGMGGRVVLGHLAALPSAGAVLLLTMTSGVQGGAYRLLLGMALALYLLLGVVIPRRPVVQAQQERRRLRVLTPGLISYVQVGLAGYDAPATLLERYCARPRAHLLPMQRVVTEALHVMQTQRLRPFAALRTIAQARGCQELTDVCVALAQAEQEGSDVQEVLATHATTLTALLNDEFTRMIKRRTLYLLGLVAVSLVVGIVGNLLFVMTSGGRLLLPMGG